MKLNLVYFNGKDMATLPVQAVDDVHEISAVRIPFPGNEHYSIEISTQGEHLTARLTTYRCIRGFKLEPEASNSIKFLCPDPESENPGYKAQGD